MIGTMAIPTTAPEVPEVQSVTQSKISPLSRKIPLVVLAFLALAGVAYGGYRCGRKATQPEVSTLPSEREPEVAPTTPPVPEAPVIGDIVTKVRLEFEKYEKSYDSEVRSTTSGHVWWISPDYLNIINEDSLGAELRLFNCEYGADPKLDFKGAARQIGLAVSRVMMQNGFEANLENSSESIEDDQFYDYIQAYQKEGTRCVFTASPDCGAAGDEDRFYHILSFACTDQFDSNYQEQAPYLKDLEIEKAVIRISKKSGNFVKLAVNYRRSGFLVFAKLIDGKWTQIHAGHTEPPCDVAEQYQVPSEFMDTCWDQDAGEQVPNNF